MGASLIPAPASGYSVPNWQPVANASPSGVTNYTFSGLSGYAKYRILITNLTTTSGSTTILLRINADTGTNYTYGYTTFSGATVSGVTGSSTSIPFGATSNSNATSLQADIDHALLATPKFVSGTAVGPSNVDNPLVNGWYNTTSTISSLTLLLNAYNFLTSTIYLLGAN